MLTRRLSNAARTAVFRCTLPRPLPSRCGVYRCFSMTTATSDSPAVDSSAQAAAAALPNADTIKPLRTGGRVKKVKPAAMDDASAGGASAWAPIRGTHDCLPALSSRQRSVESLLSNLASQYSYGEVRTPLLERAELFSRSLGDESDVVSKEMFRFDDHGTNTVLRPEATASVARALLYGGQLISSTPSLQRYWYSGPMFRRERPQAGRYRQFLQFGIEIIGGGGGGTGAGATGEKGEREAVAAETEVIHMAATALRRMGLLRYTVLELNSLGDAESRSRYVEALTTFLQEHRSLLSEESQQRLARGTVLRILDSKEPQDQAVLRGEASPINATAAAAAAGAAGADSPSPSSSPRRASAPLLRDYLSPLASSRFLSLQISLSFSGIKFQINPYLVRGLDYYSHTCFEFKMDSEAIQKRIKQLQQEKQQQQQHGSKKRPAAPSAAAAAVPAQATVLAGGRYDGLFQTLGGPSSVPAIGWAAGIDRLLLLSDLVQPSSREAAQIALPLPAPIGIVLNNETASASASTAATTAASGTDTDAPSNVLPNSTPAAAAERVTLEEAHAALCAFVRDGCILPTTAASSSASPSFVASAASQPVHAPFYSVVQSFHPNMWKALKQVTRSSAAAAAAAAGETTATATTAASQQAASPPPVAAVLILGAQELAANQVQFRDQRTREQSNVKLEELASRLHAAASEQALTRSLPPVPSSAPLTFAALRDAYRSL